MVARRERAARWCAVRSYDVLARDLLAAERSWTVHSAFRSAFNLRAADGALLGIVAEPAGNGPATLVLRMAEASPEFSPLLSPGDAVQRTSEQLTVGAQLVLDLRPAALWRPAPIERTLPVDEIAARLARVVQIASTEVTVGGLAPLLPEARSLAGDGDVAPAPSTRPVPSSHVDLTVQLARTSLRRIAAAIRAQRWEAVLPPARELSGLGPGLTPSGDDALVGLVLGLRAGQGSLPAPLQSVLLAAVEGRTTDLAAARVQHAVAGHGDEAMHRLLVSLVSGSGDDLDASVRSILAYGHSSGADSLVGLLVGLPLGILGYDVGTSR